ncbi:MAG: SDR family oxidoreductase [Streptosporangiales bacterium]|nr:SDR family oxidoreductase [Streptosporangiales bacterium]
MTGRDGRPRTVAVVLAGGVGERVGLKVPKQLVRLAGRPIIEHTIAAFQRAPEIDDILVMMAPGHTLAVEKIVAEGGYDKVVKVLEGGATRTETTWRALSALGEEECHVLLHDGVRPLVRHRIIADCVRALREHEAVEAAIPSSDTVVTVAEASGGEVVREILDRSRLRRCQTPQAFRLSTIRRAYELAMADPDLVATDDAGIVVRYLPEVPVHVIPGSEHNIKVTHAVDLDIAERLLRPSLTPAPAGHDRGLLAGRTVVVFDGGCGAGGRLADLARAHGAYAAGLSAGFGDDVADPARVSAALAAAVEETGRIDHVVWFPAPPRLVRLADIEPVALAEAMRTAGAGPAVVARAAVEHLARDGGSLLLASAGENSPVDAGVTGAAAAGTPRLARTLAHEWSELGVRVNGLVPNRAGLRGGDDAWATALAETALDILVSPLHGHIIEATES